MQLNEQQQHIIDSKSNNLVIGAPGTGKTMSMLFKIKDLILKGEDPEHIAVACFNPQSTRVFKSLLLKLIGNDAKKVKYGTFKDFAAAELKASGLLELVFADNSQMRRLLHQAKQEIGFKGSVHEAEHIVRCFKSKAKKPQKNEDHYNLFEKYQDLLLSRKWYDRYDCLRQHLISLRNDITQPVRVKHMFIDNAQDLNQIQLLWILENSISGIKVNLFMDDDQTMFIRSGALGAKIIDTVLDCEVKFEKTVLEHSYRMTNNLKNNAYKIISMADQRFLKGDITNNNYKSSIELKKFNSKKQEIESIIANLKQYFKMHPKARVAVMTRLDDDARFIINKFNSEGFPYTDFSRSIWELPGALIMVDLLEVLLGTSSSAVLKNVLSGYGISTQTIDEVFSKGLDGKNWLQSGAKIDRNLITNMDEQKKMVEIQSMLSSYYSVRLKVSFKKVFKSLCFEIMKTMTAEDKKDALYAIETVMNFKGDIQKNIEKIRKEEPSAISSQLIIGPVRSFRNFEFDMVFIPFCNNSNYPYDYKVLGKKSSSDRRILFTALTSSKGKVYISYTNQASTYLKDLRES